MTTATIIIRDEVNCKIVGLSLDTRKKLTKKFKFMIPYARHTPSFKLGRWDGMVSFFQLGGSTYINLLPDILPILLSEKYEIEVDDRRTYQTEFDFKLVDVNSYAHVKWPKGHQMEGQSVILNDHQVDTINLALQNPQSMQEVATGAGKTIITAILSQKCEEYGRTIVIVPSTQLVTQTEEDYLNMGLDVGVFYGNRKEYEKTHTICTWQSLGSMNKKSKDGSAPVSMVDFLDGVVCVMVDECVDGSTLITTPNGKVEIRNLKVGDKILNLDEDKKVYKEDVVVKVHENLGKSQKEDMYKLEFDNGQSLEVTGNHEILTVKGWVHAGDLTDDMEVIDINTYR